MVPGPDNDNGPRAENDEKSLRASIVEPLLQEEPEVQPFRIRLQLPHMGPRSRKEKLHKRKLSEVCADFLDRRRRRRQGGPAPIQEIRADLPKFMLMPFFFLDSFGGAARQQMRSQADGDRR